MDETKIYKICKTDDIEKFEKYIDNINVKAELIIMYKDIIQSCIKNKSYKIIEKLYDFQFCSSYVFLHICEIDNIKLLDQLCNIRFPIECKNDLLKYVKHYNVAKWLFMKFITNFEYDSIMEWFEYALQIEQNILSDQLGTICNYIVTNYKSFIDDKTISRLFARLCYDNNVVAIKYIHNIFGKIDIHIDILNRLRENVNMEVFKFLISINMIELTFDDLIHCFNPLELIKNVYNQSNSEKIECGICYVDSTELENTDDFILLDCNCYNIHFFHWHCIRRWFINHEKICPFCKDREVVWSKCSKVCLHK